MKHGWKLLTLTCAVLIGACDGAPVGPQRPSRRPRGWQRRPDSAFLPPISPGRT